MPHGYHSLPEHFKNTLSNRSKLLGFLSCVYGMNLAFL